MAFSPKVPIRNTPLPFVPKSKFKKKLECALTLAKDLIEQKNPSDAFHAEALTLRRQHLFLLGDGRGNLKPSSLWQDAQLLDLVGMIWDVDFLNSIHDEDSPRQLRQRARELQTHAGYLSGLQFHESRQGLFWSPPEITQFSNASKLIAQAEILQEFARVREENGPSHFPFPKK